VSATAAHEACFRFRDRASLDICFVISSCHLDSSPAPSVSAFSFAGWGASWLVVVAIGVVFWTWDYSSFLCDSTGLELLPVEWWFLMIAEVTIPKSGTRMSGQSLNTRFTHAQRKVIAELMPKLDARLRLDTSNQRTLSFTLAELESIQQKAVVARSNADNGMKRNSLRHIIEATAKAIEDSHGIGSIPASERLYQFKITLNDSKPVIWRRIQVKNGTLDKLHERIFRRYNRILWMSDLELKQTLGSGDRTDALRIFDGFCYGFDDVP